MASPSLTMQAPTQKPAAFSYAQAAKGKPAALQAPAKVAEQSPKESLNWADDSTNSSTTNDDTNTNGMSHGTAASSEASVKSSISQAPTEVVSTSVASLQLPSPSYESSRTTANKDDEHSTSLIKTTLDQSWDDSKSQTWSTSDTKGEPSEAAGTPAEASKDDSSTASRKGSVAAEPIKAPMKDATPPKVNFWQQRAETAARAKTTPVTSPNPLTPVASKDARPISQKNQLSEPHRRQSGNDAAARDVALPKSAKSKALALNNASRSEAAAVSSAISPPAAGDVTAWPTPETAKDEERRKSSVPGEKELQASSAAKGSKSEWKTLQFVPSVKFNTPLPSTRGRGASRLGARGGRGGSVSERGAQGNFRESPVDRSEQEQRLGGSHRNVPSPDKAFEKESVTADPSLIVPQQKHTSATDGLQITPSSSKRPSSNSRPSRSQDQKATESSNANMTAVHGNEDSAPKKEAYNSRRRSITSPTENAGDVVNSRPHKKSNGFVNGNELKPNGEQAFGQGKRNTPPDGHSRAPSLHHDNLAQGASYPSERGRGRADRGRGGRGRGGNPYHAGSQHPHGMNGTMPMLQTSPHKSGNAFAPYSAGPVPSAFEQRKGGTPRGGLRSASIPSDIPYNSRYSPAYSMDMYQTFSPSMNASMFDYGGMTPATPLGMPFVAYVDPNVHLNLVIDQLSYYFSIDNLLKDMYLRKHMDSKGFVSLSLIANFKKMLSLTNGVHDVEMIRHACYQSKELELRTSADGQWRVRRKQDWHKFVLNMPERDESARNDGPPEPQHYSQQMSHTQMPFQPQSAMQPSPVSPMYNGMQNGMNSHMQSAFSPSFSPGGAASPYFSPQSPRDTLNRQSLSILDNTIAHQHQHSRQVSTASNEFSVSGADEDNFPSEKIPTLVVAFKKVDGKPAQVNGAPRAFSNGSVELEDTHDRQPRSRSPKPVRSKDGEQRNASSQRGSLVVEPDSQGRPLFWLNCPDNASYWLKGADTASSHLPADGDEIPYIAIRHNAISERDDAAARHAPNQMDVLYHFWSDFLIRNFNSKMYREFKDLALADAREGRTQIGLQNLIQYYNEALNSQQTIRKNVAQDYVDLVKGEDHSKPRPAFELLRQAWRNGRLNMKSRKILSDFVDAQLRIEFEGSASSRTA